MEKSDWAYDVEVFPNFADASFLNVDDPHEIKTFVVSWPLKIDEKDKMKEFLDTRVNRLIGYNSLFYDTPILMFICNYNGKDINKDIFDLSHNIISSERGESYNNSRNAPWPQLDLMKLMAFDKLGVSLKQCAINLKWYKIQDLPLSYDHIVERDEVELILKYNINDVLITFELYKALQDKIALRKELGELYNVDLTSASDSKIANVLLEKFYTDETGIDIKDLKYQRTKRDFLWLKDCICPGITFKTKKLRDLKFETANTLVVAENNWAYKKKLEFGNCCYELGVGGLHSDDGPVKFVSDDKYIIRDLDVASYYPNIIINNKIKPEHLDETFLSILKKITLERIEAKKTKNKTKAEGLKITINSIFGKLGSETFWLEDPKAMLSVTVSGQLFLLMLIEELTLAGILVISTNTDGIVCKIDRTLEEKYYQICKDWQEKTGFQLEYTDYSLYVRSDVNNYLTKKASGETKEKGRYIREIDLKKGYRYPVVPKMIYEYFINNKSLDETITDNKDILDYCISQKAGRDFAIEYRTNDETISLQKTNRFYISKNGGTIMKVHKTKGTEIGINVGKLCTIINDYDEKVPFEEYQLDFDFYKEEAQKYIDEIEKSTFLDELIPEELSNTAEDGDELDIDNFDTTKIVVKPPKFRYSKSSYYFDKENSTIYRGIGSIKYVTSNVSKELLKLSKNYYPTFVEFLIDQEENCSINSRQMETLIKLNFFEEFGNNKKLLDVYIEFSKGKNKYNKKLKDTTRDKRKVLLIDFEKSQPNKRMNILDQINFENDLLDYVQTTYCVDKRYTFVSKLQEFTSREGNKYAPRIDLLCLATGKSQQVKVKIGIYNNNPILAGDIIKCNSFSHEDAVKKVDDMWIKNETAPKVWWLNSYDVLKSEEIDKLIE